MMAALRMEFHKTRRRKIWLIVLALIAVQLLWFLWGIGRMDADDLRDGWMFVLYQFPMLNTILLPVIAAVVASRLSDMEHKGQTMRLLGTIIAPGRLFTAKFLCGGCYILSLAAFQVLLMVAIGRMVGFEGAVPWGKMAQYWLFTSAVTLTILLLQQVLSLMWINQMISLSVGLIGSFAGLFSLFFGGGFHKLLLWSYYGVLLFVSMDWNPDTRVIHYAWTPVDWSGLLILAAVFAVIYAIGRGLFVRKEY